MRNEFTQAMLDWCTECGWLEAALSIARLQQGVMQVRV